MQFEDTEIPDVKIVTPRKHGDALGRAPVAVKRITTADYPTPAKRPANSRLDNSKLAKAFGVALPDWRQSAKTCVARLLAPGAH